MKMQYQHLLLLIFFALPLTITAQSGANGQGGSFPQQHACLPESHRNEIKQALVESIRALGLGESSNGRVVDDLKFPLRAAAAIPGYHHFWSVSGYVDHNASSGIQDYNCQNQTYNGHRGSDYFTFPFSFYLYNNDLVEVIAAAPGTILSKQDGNSDTNCSPSGSWNAVYVRHADGSVMWYGHLKNGSLTSKNIGASVEEGEYLGILASSGYSSGPHLHIEYYHENGNLLDPYQGSCNDLNSSSLWGEQPLHTQPKVNAVLTHPFIPNLDCGLNVESVDLVNEFYAGDQTVVAIYITDYVAGMVASTRILRPDGSQFNSFNTFNTQNSYDWFWNSRNYWLDEDDPEGEWTIECTFNGVTYTHTFQFQHEVTSIDDLNENEFSLFPNPAQDKIIISGSNWRNQTYRLVNALGQEVDHGILDQQELSIQNIEAGLYLLIIGTGKNTTVRKVIKH